MAILKGIEVSVVIDGKALTEYDDEDAANENSDHPSEVSKYIEAIPDAEFSIDITMPRSYNFAMNHLSFRLSLDGTLVRNRVYPKAHLKRLRKDWHENIAGSPMKNGEKCYLRPFKFNDIKIGKTTLNMLMFHQLRYSVEASSSTAGSERSNGVAKLGTITLDVFEVEVTGKEYIASSGAPSLSQSSEIAEKELKGRNVTLQSRYANYICQLT